VQRRGRKQEKEMKRPNYLGRNCSFSCPINFCEGRKERREEEEERAKAGNMYSVV